jgi:putative copper export protein
VPVTIRHDTDSLSATADSSASAAHRPTPQDASFVLVRSVSYTALLLLIGAVSFRVAVLPRVDGAGGMDARVVQRTLGGGAAIAALAFVITSGVRLAMQSRMMRDASMSVAQLEDMAMATRWGGVWRVQLAAGVVALVGATLAMRGRRAGWTLAALACVAASLGVALGGHAATVERYRTLSVLDDALHVLAASAWLGTLFWLAVAGLRAPLPAGAPRAGHVAAMVNAFSPVALVSASVVVLTGLVTAWQRLDHVADLWTTPYGEALFRKLVLVGVVLLVGAFNWRRVRPTLGTDAASGLLRRSAWAELGMGLLVLVATAVLVATPTR